MGSIGLKNVFSFVGMCFLVAAFVFSILKYTQVGSYAVGCLVILGLMIVYIVVVVGIFTAPVETQLVQFWDIVGFGGCLGIGLVWIMIYKGMGDQELFPFLAGLMATIASIMLLLDAIFCNK